MPEDAEVPTEHLQEAAEHNLHRQHEASHGNQELRWPSLAALSAAFFAVFAAISALLAGHDANEAMIEQIRGSDGYAYYQAKGIKSAIIQAKVDMLRALGREPASADLPSIERYKKEQEEIKHDADQDVASAKAHMDHHAILARSVTLFQIAIAMAATSILTKRKSVWQLSLLMGLGGVAFLVHALL